jgi:hypothetical protein
MGEHNSRTLITYECGHSQLYGSPAPKLGEMVLCLRCRKYRKVITAPNEWRIKCRGCIYSRPFGQAQLNAEIAAAKHRMKNPAHIVDIWNGNVIRKSFGLDRNQTVIKPIPNSDQIPGF